MYKLEAFIIITFGSYGNDKALCMPPQGTCGLTTMLCKSKMLYRLSYYKRRKFKWSMIVTMATTQTSSILSVFVRDKGQT